MRLATGVLRTLAKRTARQLQDGLPQSWKWNGRDVFIADGSHVSMPDTPENQAAYPQVYNQEPGIGFPLARVAVLLSLASGAFHDLAVAAYAGKGSVPTSRAAWAGSNTAPSVLHRCFGIDFATRKPTSLSVSSDVPYTVA